MKSLHFRKTSVLKVPKCEIFNRSDFHDFYTMKGSIWSCEIPYEYAPNHVLTNAYHPQSNGMVECVHRQIKDTLRALGAGPA
jgi:hypothetical protein